MAPYIPTFEDFEFVANLLNCMRRGASGLVRIDQGWRFRVQRKNEYPLQRLRHILGAGWVFGPYGGKFTFKIDGVEAMRDALLPVWTLLKPEVQQRFAEIGADPFAVIDLDAPTPASASGKPAPVPSIYAKRNTRPRTLPADAPWGADESEIDDWINNGKDPKTGLYCHLRGAAIIMRHQVDPVIREMDRRGQRDWWAREVRAEQATWGLHHSPPPAKIIKGKPGDYFLWQTTRMPGPDGI